MQISDDIMLGPVSHGNAINNAGPSPMEKGVGPMGRIYYFDVVPLTKNTTGLATGQAVGGAGNLTLTAGTGVTSVTRSDGTTALQLDTPRCIDVVSANAGDTTQTVTFSGYDQYGFPMTQAVTLNGVTRVATTKAFFQVTQIAVSASTAGNVSAGTTDTLGIPYRITDKVYVGHLAWNNTLARDTGTFTTADTTSPATSSTGDVRGTYAPSSATDGTKRLVLGVILPAIASGPNATEAGAYGVPQV